MKAAVLLLLFFCPSPTSSQGQVDGFTLQEGTGKEVDVPLTLPALWDELKGLKELVLSLRAGEVGQRMALRGMETQLRDREVEAQEQRGSIRALEEAMSEHREELRNTKVRMDTGRSLLTERNSALTSRVDQLDERNTIQANELLVLKSHLSNSSILMEDLETMNTALMAELPFLQMRLRASEGTVEQLRVKTSALAARMCKAEGLLEELKMPNSAAANQLLALHSRLDALEEEVNKSSGSGAILNKLSSLENSVVKAETTLERFRDENVACTKTVRGLERQVEELKTESSVQADAVKQLQLRMISAESRTQQLDAVSTAQTSKLLELERDLMMRDGVLDMVNKALENRSIETRLEELKTESTALQVRVSGSEAVVHELNAEIEALGRTLRSSEEQLKTQTIGLEKRLSSCENHLNVLRTENTAHEAELSAVTLRLNTTERQIHQLTTQHTDRRTAVDRQTEALQVRVSGSEAVVHELNAEIEELQSRLNVSEKQLVELKKEAEASSSELSALGTKTEDVSSRLKATGDQLQQLRNANADELKVAFSAGLTDSGAVGPFDEEKTLIFTKTFINIGRAYNQTAGVFTAPLRGVYFFSFTAADFLKGYMGVYLYKNSQPITFSLDLNDHGGYASASNGVALQLEGGDVVCLSLPASYRLYDDSRNFSIFSGFLLFPL